MMKVMKADAHRKDTMQLDCLLRDPLVTWTADGPVPRETPLPDLLAHLLTGSTPNVRFPRLRAEQRSHWWRFLVRCAAQILHDERLPVADLETTDEDALALRLRGGLARRTNGEEAWRLHQPNPAQPGFLQPPTPDGAPPEDGYKHNTPSFLTTAIGTKNFERKIDVFRELEPEEAVHALVEFQGGAIFGGRGNYGSQIMGSGSGKGSGTPFMGVLLPEGDCATFRHDVGVLLDSWDEMVEDVPLEGDVWALWTVPWDGTRPLPASRLTPAFIPLARLVRLGPPNDRGRFDTVYFKPSEGYRVLDHTDGGRFGDPFTPLVQDRKGHMKVRGAVAIDPHRSAYDYREVAGFFADKERTLSPTVQALANFRMNQETEVSLVLEAVAFDQGKTLGFHRRVCPMPILAVRLSRGDESPLRVAHQSMLDRVGEVSKALRAAVRVLLHGEPRPRAGDDDKVMAAARTLDEAIDEIYLRFLFQAARRQADGDEEYQKEWVSALCDLAISALRSGMDVLPRPGARSYERLVRPEAYLRWRLRKVREDAGITSSPSLPTGSPPLDPGGVLR